MNAKSKFALMRRELFCPGGGLIGVVPAFLGAPRPVAAAAPTTAGKVQLGPDLHESAGVRPFINRRGTLTMIRHARTARGPGRAGVRRARFVALNGVMGAGIGDDRTAHTSQQRGGGRGARGAGPTGVSITTYMMSPAEEQVVADRIHAVLFAPRTAKPATGKPPAGDLAGRWAVYVEFTAGTGDHVLHVRQQSG